MLIRHLILTRLFFKTLKKIKTKMLSKILKPCKSCLSNSRIYIMALSRQCQPFFMNSFINKQMYFLGNLQQAVVIEDKPINELNPDDKNEVEKPNTRKFNQIKIGKADLIKKLDSVKALIDYHDCLNDLLHYSHNKKDLINDNGFKKFLISLGQILKYQNVNLNFLKKSIKFLYRYDLLQTYNLNLICQKILIKRNDLITKQNEFRDIICLLISIQQKDINIDDLFNNINKLLLTSNIDTLDDLTLIDIIYAYNAYSQISNTVHKSKLLLMKLTSELLSRIDKFDKNTLIYSSKLYAALSSHIDDDLELSSPIHDHHDDTKAQFITEGTKGIHSQHQHHKLPQQFQYEQCLMVLDNNIANILNNISYEDMLYIMLCMSSRKRFNKEFCAKYEENVINNIANYTKNQLYEIYNFMTLDSFKLLISTNIIYSLQIEICYKQSKNINNYTLKDIEQIYNNKLNRLKGEMTIIDKLFKLATIGQNHKYHQSILHKRNVHNLLDNNLASDSGSSSGSGSTGASTSIGNDSMTYNTASIAYNDGIMGMNNMNDIKRYEKEIIEMIKYVNNPIELKQILNVCNMLYIKNYNIIHNIYLQLINLIQTNEISLTILSNIMNNLLNLGYCININKSHSIIFDNIIHQIQNRIHTATPIVCLDLIRFICIYQLYDNNLSKKDNKDENNITIKEVLYKSILGNIVDKIINEQYFYIINERLQILKHLSLSELTCNVKLIEYLLSHFNPDKNKYYSREIKQINYRKLYMLLNHIQKSKPELSYNDIPSVMELYKKGQEYYNTDSMNNSPLKGYKGDIGNKLKEYIKANNLELTLEENKFTNWHEFDYILTDTRTNVDGTTPKTLYLDVYNENQYMNSPNQTQFILEPFALSKKLFMKKYGYQYKIINTTEWKKAVKSKFVEQLIKSTFSI